MRTRGLLMLALGVSVASGLAWWLLDRDARTDAVSQALALPGLADRVEAIDRIELLAAGASTLVLIEKQDGQWRMPDRDGWPANQREVGSALFRLGQAKRIDAKTADPKRHARLGVEDINAADAKGARLVLSVAGTPAFTLTVGNAHPALGGSYVRVGDQAQVWLLDQDIAPARSAPDWLDRRLFDVPLARVDRVRIMPAQGSAFELSRVDDRFSVDGRSPTLLADPDVGNATADFVDQLPLDDVAKDSGAVALQTAVFETVDGLRLTVAAWPQDGGTWARLSVDWDEARASAWFARPATPAAVADADSDAVTVEPAQERLVKMRTQVEAWRESFAGRQFLLPPDRAEGLMRPRADYLRGSP